MSQIKKQFGQHFLYQSGIAEKIAQFIIKSYPDGRVLEVGVGQGILTKYLQKHYGKQFFVSEIDDDLLPVAKEIVGKSNTIAGDFLKINISEFSDTSFALVGNFPYNISNSILFKILDNYCRIPYVVGMFQKEVADRIVSPHGSKMYGITSVLMQTFYTIEKKMQLPPGAFKPPPKVKSTVLHFTTKNTNLPVDYPYFKNLVKAAFNKRRKTLKNALNHYSNLEKAGIYLQKRAEELSVKDFTALALLLKK